MIRKRNPRRVKVRRYDKSGLHTCADRRQVSVYSSGPGGMICSCCGCGPFGGRKILHNRILRRRERQRVRLLAREGTTQ